MFGRLKSTTTITSSTTRLLAGGSEIRSSGTRLSASIVHVQLLPNAAAALGAAVDCDDKTVRSLCRMGKRAQKPYDPKRKPNFNAWLARVVSHMSVSKSPYDKRTSSLILLFETVSF